MAVFTGAKDLDKFTDQPDVFGLLPTHCFHVVIMPCQQVFLYDSDQIIEF